MSATPTTIDGANAALAFLERHDLPEAQVMTVWESIRPAHDEAGSPTTSSWR